MPVTAYWHDEAKTIVRVEFVDPWNMTELSQAIQGSRQLMSGVDYTVDAIWDATNTKGVPSNLFSHFMIANEDTDIPTNQRFVVVVVHGALLQTFAGMAKRLLPRITKNMHVAMSLQTAEQKITSLRGD